MTIQTQHLGHAGPAGGYRPSTDDYSSLLSSYRADVASGRWLEDDNDPDFVELHSFFLAEAERGNIKNDNGQRLDAGETATIARQLLYVKAKTYDVKYANLRAMDFIPVGSEVPAGAEQWSYWSYDMAGMALIIANYATDFARADVKVSETVQSVKSVGASYGYSVQDLRRIAMMGQSAGNLDAKRAMAARRMIAAAFDDLAAVGNPSAGFTGFINNPNIPVMALPTGSWAVASALQIIADMNAMVNKVFTQTLTVHQATALIMPDAEWSQISSQPYSTLGNMTILNWFTANNPTCKSVDQWVKLRNMNATGTGGRCMAYEKSEEVLSMEIALAFTETAPQIEGLQYTIFCEGRFAGTAVYYPLACVAADGSS